MRLSVQEDGDQPVSTGRWEPFWVGRPGGAAFQYRKTGSAFLGGKTGVSLSVYDISNPDSSAVRLSRTGDDEEQYHRNMGGINSSNLFANNWFPWAPPAETDGAIEPNTEIFHLVG